jgi:F-type H+-transporting ATPase subunit a
MNPLHQFTVRHIIPLNVFGLDLSLTNSSLFILFAAVFGFFILYSFVKPQREVPGTGQALVEALYRFIVATARDTIGPKYKAYVPFIFSVFIMIFMGNLLGLFPYGFTFTSQLAPVGAFAVLGLFVSAIVGIYHQKLRWFRTFLPSGIPVILAPIVIPIEIISFVAKPFSLTVRLVMNMIVGHILLKILAGFVFSSGLVGVFPLLFVALMIIFEMGIAFLQAYIYTILTSIYLGESLNSHS